MEKQMSWSEKKAYLANLANEEKKLYQGLILDNKDRPVPCVENATKLLKSHPIFDNLIKFDEWKQKMFFNKNGKWRSFFDVDYIEIQCLFQSEIEGFQRVAKNIVIDAVDNFARGNSYDSAMEYLNEIRWDNIDRLSTWISKAFGTLEDEYHAKIGENYLKGMVSRVINPGSKFDYVLCIEGKQGIGKTTSLRELAGDLGCLETMVDPDNKDFLLQMQGQLIIEFSEGVIMNKKDANNLKGFVSRQSDFLREPYGKITREYPRRCVFAMTTNSDVYLKDDTGNRRFLPIYAEKADYKWIKENRDQLFAEALYRIEKKKESFHKFVGLEEIQEEKLIVSPYYDKIERWLQGGGQSDSDFGKSINLDDGFTVMDIWTCCLHGSETSLKKWDEMAIAGDLRKIGYEKVRKRIDSEKRMIWIKK